MPYLPLLFFPLLLTFSFTFSSLLRFPTSFQAAGTRRATSSAWRWRPWCVPARCHRGSWPCATAPTSCTPRRLSTLRCCSAGASSVKRNDDEEEEDEDEEKKKRRRRKKRSSKEDEENKKTKMMMMMMMMIKKL